MVRFHPDPLVDGRPPEAGRPEATSTWFDSPHKGDLRTWLPTDCFYGMVTNKAINTYNKSWYDAFWKNYKIPKADFWPHWRIVKPYLGGKSLEIGPGTKPKLPIRGNYFIEISNVAVKRLRQLGGKTYTLDLTDKLPFLSGKFDLICAFEVLEHVQDDIFVLRQINRILKKNGVCLISFPLNTHFWNSYDATVGHVRRYNPEKIEETFAMCGLKIVKYAGLNIPWPGKISGFFLSFLAKKFPRLVAKIGSSLDIRPNSPLCMPIDLAYWNEKSYEELFNFTTGFFILKKKFQRILN